MPETQTPTVPAAAPASNADALIPKAKYDEIAGRLGSTLQTVEALQKQVAEFTSKNDAAEKARLASQGEFQKIAEAEKARADKAAAELADAKAKYEADTKAYQLGIAAKNAGIVDANDAVRLIDISQLPIKDGKIEGVDDAVAALKTAKPYLFGAPSAPQPHGDRPKGGAITKAELLKDYSLADKMSRENPAEFQRLMAGA